MNTPLHNMVGQDDDDENPLTVGEQVEDIKRSISSFERYLEEALTYAASPDAAEDAQQCVDELRELIGLHEAHLKELEETHVSGAE
ncbi:MULTISPECIES: hypothetical protein [unclassified Massilia]|uniref:hypothetical protein n=1 Tax=Massilia TaxID=149698 RepID=UPI0014208340|nr:MULTISPECIES: hypothetical protein [unclassified Massilia]MDQ1817761.1 hypothetical protein [Massilia sp. CCM 9210]NHZ99097.1 hypothetical protein [Massilia sp. CCM 8734]